MMSGDQSGLMQPAWRYATPPVVARERVPVVLPVAGVGVPPLPVLGSGASAGLSPRLPRGGRSVAMPHWFPVARAGLPYQTWRQ